MNPLHSALRRLAGLVCALAGFLQTSTGLAGSAHFIPFNFDAGTGVSTSKVYTHLLDFGTATGDYTNTVVNGVAFTNVKASAGTTIGTDGLSYGWSGFPAKSDAKGQASYIKTPEGNNIRNVLYDANYGLPPER